MGSAKSDRRKPKSCLGQVFNFKLVCFSYERYDMAYTHTLTSRVQKLVQVLSSSLSQGILNEGDESVPLISLY